MVAIGGVLGVHVCAIVPDLRVMVVWLSPWFGSGLGAGVGGIVGLAFGGVAGLRYNEGTFNILRLERGLYNFRTLFMPFVRDQCGSC